MAQNETLRGFIQQATLFRHAAATKTIAITDRQENDIITSTQAIENVNTSLQTFLAYEEVAQTFEELTSGATGAAEDDDEDGRWEYSVATEVGPGACSG